MTLAGPNRRRRYRRFALQAAATLTVVAVTLLIAFDRGMGTETGAAAVGGAVQGTAERGPCLLPPSEMRREHMELLFEERRLAVRKGIRDPDVSLQRCVACHAVRDASTGAVSFEDPRHFCRTCHDQAAVSIDCFSCHRSTPAAPIAAGGRQ